MQMDRNEINRRKKAVEFVIANNSLENIKTPKETLKLMDEYVVGKITEDDFVSCSLNLYQGSISIAK